MWQPHLADPTPWGWALLLGLAAALSAAIAAGVRRGRWAWAWPSALLAMLVVDRLIDLGLLVYFSDRRALQSLDVYGGRRPWQVGGSIALAAAVVVLTIAAVRAGRSGRLGPAWWAIVLSALALVAIQAIRITSLHEVDAWMGMPLPFPGDLRLFQALPMAPIALALAGALAGAFGTDPARHQQARPGPRPAAPPPFAPTGGPHWAIRLAVLLLALTAPEWAALLSRHIGPEPPPSRAVDEGGR